MISTPIICGNIIDITPMIVYNLNYIEFVLLTLYTNYPPVGIAGGAVLWAMKS